MYFFSLETVTNSFIQLKDKTPNKFWGLLGVLKCINSYVLKSEVTYTVSGEKLSLFLDDVFYLGEDNRDYGDSVWFVKFSKYWMQKIKDNFLVQPPGIYIVIAFLYKNKAFEKQLSSDELLGLFAQDYHLSIDQINEIFDTKDKFKIEYTTIQYSKINLFVSIKENLKNQSLHSSISMESPYSVVARPGELSRAPFIQTIYAGQQSLECLIMAKFDIEDFYPTEKTQKTYQKIKSDKTNYEKYLIAIRTKPFILLAGISGIGKSRIVRELAFMSCPISGKLQYDETTPGNYCMIEVKPNWHDSSELLGYASGIKVKYLVTPFVKFLVKAMRYPEVPFFVCLDEMNLAPVEQYFAEYLSVLETRKMNGNAIVSGSLINKDVFIKYEADIFIDLGLKSEERNDLENEWEINTAIENELKEFGLRIPQNIVVVGTVNMDDTTHQFSRKVIDRAMTIEMNHANFAEMFSNEDMLQYTLEPLPYELLIADCANAKHAFEFLREDSELLKLKSVEIMKTLDEKLQHTPFRVAYRVQNEMVLYFRNMRFTNPGKSFDELFISTVDAILNMKVLPRIEGDEDLVEKPLKELLAWSADNGYNSSNAKIKEMVARLERTHYTSYWP